MNRDDLEEQLFLIYTTEEGGFYKTPVGKGGIRRFTREEYEEIKRTGEFTWNAKPWSEIPCYTTEKPVMIALVRVEDAHDFTVARLASQV